MKRYISVLVLIAMLGAMVMTIIPSAAAAPTLTTDKTTYAVGEPVMVTASSTNSSNKDWIGIAPKGGEKWGTIRWIYTRDMNGAVDITTAGVASTHSYLAPYKKFPAGEYTVYLVPDDLGLNGNLDKVLAKVDITIGTPDEFLDVEVKAPTSATYTPEDEFGEVADGTFDVTFTSGHNAEEIHVWWGDDDGRLADYGRVARFSVGSSWKTELSFEMPAGIYVPEAATCMVLYSYNELHGYSDSYCVMSIPEGLAQETPDGDPIIEFQVVSDAHLSEALYADNFEKMLTDIAQNSPNSIGIFAVGDMVDDGTVSSQWEKLWSIYDSVEGAPNLYIGMGEREINTFESYDEALESFLENIRFPEGYGTPETPYYDLWIGGLHFIFLGSSEISDDGHATIGNDQYAWLAEKLEENADGRPIFLFMHQSLRDTVAGSTADEGWWGIDDGAVLRSLLQDYPQIIMFNGHSHWSLDSENTMYGGDGKATIFNTAGVGYLKDAYKNVTGDYLDGSQGYYVKVYEDAIVVQGRDFIEGEWVVSAQFTLTGVSIPEDVGGSDIKLPEKETPEDPTEKPTDNSDNDGDPTEKPTDSNGDTSSPGKSGGCGSSISTCGMMLLVAIAGAALTIFKRK